MRRGNIFNRRGDSFYAGTVTGILFMSIGSTWLSLLVLAACTLLHALWVPYQEEWEDGK